MIRTLILAITLAITTSLSFAKDAPAKKASAPMAFAADASKSTVEWFATKLTGKHNGTAALSNGTLTMDASGQPTGGKFEVNVAALAVTDIPKDDKYNQKLVDHLKSPDFFSTDKFPTAQLEVTKLEKLAKADADGNTHTATGTLTIKGITKPITFPAKVSTQGKMATFAGTMTVDRTMYDIKYNSGKFFPNIGDKMIHDQFKIVAKIEATKS